LKGVGNPETTARKDNRCSGSIETEGVLEKRYLLEKPDAVTVDNASPSLKGGSRSRERGKVTKKG